MNVLSIAAADRFLVRLVQSLVDGHVIKGFSLDDPSDLGKAIFYVPTRRTADALRQALLDLMRTRGTPSLILPRIQVIGDVDEDILPLKVAAGADDGFWHLPQAMDDLHRRLTMTQLVHYWSQRYAREVLALSPDQDLHVSATPSDAAYLAIDLLNLIDAVHREGSDWRLLDDLVPEDYSAFWQKSLEFLKIATNQWPSILDASGQVDPVQRRNAVLELEIKAIAAHDGPVIAAGSTGSIPATANLLAAVACHPQGALVLPGLDFHLDEASWQSIGMLHPVESQLPPVAGHPQFNLKQLLDRLHLGREDVLSLSKLSSKLTTREMLVSEALRPAENTDLWASRLTSISAEAREEATADIAIAEADGEQEEARIAALALREVLSDENKKAALVTPDRALARRVLLELKRWDIEVEDTAGMPLGETPPALLMRLMVECLTSHFDPVCLLALLKHPLASFGMDRGEVRQAARFLELALLRGPRLGPGLAPLLEEFSRREHEALAEGNISDARMRDWLYSATLLQQLEKALSPLVALTKGIEPAHPFPTWLKAIIASLESVAMEKCKEDDTGGTPNRLYDKEAGRLLRDFFDRALSAGADGALLQQDDLASFLVAMMSGQTVRDLGAGTPRLQLLGTLEARLMDVDRVVIGGLNEGSWPGDIKGDAWLSRPMRAGMKLEPPERRIGLAAHDFAQSMGRAEVVLLRASKTGGEPTVPSRWLQRLEAVAGEPQVQAMHARGQIYQDWAKQLDAPRQSLSIRRPAPTPPLEMRPRRLSVTEIETWIRDPYAIYAKHVLGLRALDEIGTPPGGAEKGSIIHDILADFAQKWHRPFDEAAFDKLIEIGKDAFTRLDNFPDVQAFWWPRFERIAHWYIFEWEAPRSADVAGRHSEVSGKITLPMRKGDFELRGRADRLDIMHGDILSIIDFKTGTPPSAKQVIPGFAPQLALEGYMAKQGGFETIPRNIEIADMAWIQLSGGRDPGKVKSGIERNYAAEDIVEIIGKRLLALIVAYDDPTQAYLSRARPMFERFESPYDHLARVKEWSMQEGETE